MSDGKPQQSSSVPSEDSVPTETGVQKSALQDGKRKAMHRRRSVVVDAPAADADADGSEETEASRVMK